MNFLKAFDNSIKLTETAENEFIINSEATLPDGTAMIAYIINNDGTFFFSDKKKTLKYMNDRYELASKDVKMCISNILKLYGFKITGGELLAKITDETVIADKYFDFLMCISQMVNMYVFFDEPKS